jgi:hypothetical protein
MVSSVTGVAAYPKAQSVQPVRQNHEKPPAPPVKKKEPSQETPQPHPTARKKHAVDVKV